MIDRCSGVGFCCCFRFYSSVAVASSSSLLHIILFSLLSISIFYLFIFLTFAQIEHFSDTLSHSSSTISLVFWLDLTFCVVLQHQMVERRRFPVFDLDFSMAGGGGVKAKGRSHTHTLTLTEWQE